tara:strand:- start:763 stop:894 length:132 start_codon:yes stop_codon:yes gene_type:complete
MMDEKIKNYFVLTILFLIIMLFYVMLGAEFVCVCLLFYLSFIK